jgi:ADP-heptose:LPS heptosyltransferase
MATRSILLITLSNVGDAVMTTPVMTALHDTYPLAAMDIVTDARAAPLFSHCPWRGDIILKDKQAAACPAQTHPTGNPVGGRARRGTPLQCDPAARTLL